MTSPYMEALPTTALQYLHLGCSKNSCVQSFRVFHHAWYCLLTVYIDNTSSFINCNISSILQLCMSSYMLYTLVPSCRTEQSVHHNLESNHKIPCMENYWSCRHTILMHDVQNPIFSQHTNESYANNKITQNRWQ